LTAMVVGSAVRKRKKTNRNKAEHYFNRIG